MEYFSFEGKREKTDENGMKRIQRGKRVSLNALQQPAGVGVKGELGFNAYLADYTRHGTGP
jgi:hypothetical protein